MLRKSFILNLIICFGVIACMTSCNKNLCDFDQEIKYEKIIVKNFGEFTFEDSILILAANSQPIELKTYTDPVEALQYYSKNNEDFKILTTEWILIDSTFEALRFYAVGEGCHATELHKIDFGYTKDTIISKVEVEPNPFTNVLAFTFDSRNVRGSFSYTIYDIKQKIVSTGKGFIKSDKTEYSLDVTHLSQGIYFISFSFGSTHLTNKIIKLK